jgi:hypothetical protein
MSGDFHREYIAELKTQIEERRPRMILDLKDVTLVDVDVVRFLALCLRNAIKIVHCPHYIRDWISREHQSPRGKEQ